ncbi:ribosome biogenesis factor YjgA [Balneatrix alpica]|uniref:Dual-action ribosomal maturation protein DarP n=1 Tax=Balneatrix alpica TaxID=75684 RepID=A0ABV5ZAX2_9GAMM|nr:ribosome biogenesis factor YjgA [Balneatrix alpica]
MQDWQQHDQEDEGPTKSELKRQMEALQKLGQKLTTLPNEQLAKVPMSDTLAKAVAEHKRLKQGEAKRRHLQYIGKVMRSEDAEAITLVVERFEAGSQAYTQHFHRLERWRDRLLSEGNEATAELLAQYPAFEAQHLRQLIRNAQREQAANKPPASARKLFQYLREVIEAAE